MSWVTSREPQRGWAHHVLMRSVWADRTLVGVCTLIQVSRLAPGADAGPGSLGAVATLAGLAGGLVLWWRRRMPFAVIGAATACSVLQAAIAGPVVPVAVL